MGIIKLWLMINNCAFDNFEFIVGENIKQLNRSPEWKYQNEVTVYGGHKMFFRFGIRKEEKCVIITRRYFNTWKCRNWAEFKLLSWIHVLQSNSVDSIHNGIIDVISGRKQGEEILVCSTAILWKHNPTET